MSTICKHRDNKYDPEKGNLLYSYILDNYHPVISSSSKQVDEGLKLGNEGNIAIGSGAKILGTGIIKKWFTIREAQMKFERNVELPETYEFTSSNISSALSVS